MLVYNSCWPNRLLQEESKPNVRYLFLIVEVANNVSIPVHHAKLIGNYRGKYRYHGAINRAVHQRFVTINWRNMLNIPHLPPSHCSPLTPIDRRHKIDHDYRDGYYRPFHRLSPKRKMLSYWDAQACAASCISWVRATAHAQNAFYNPVGQDCNAQKAMVYCDYLIMSWEEVRQNLAYRGPNIVGDCS